MFEERTYTVSEFNRKVKDYLEENSDLREFFLEGELSGVTYYKSGHLYFNLKDRDAQIKCVAFKYKFKRIAEDLKDGDSVKLFGDVGFYENRGDFQILVRHIEKKNQLGELFIRLEQLKKELGEAGYFDLKHKKPLPKYPKNIGVVTAYTGAAIQDIIKTIKKRDNTINIYAYPAKVQGVGAEAEIIKGIKTLNKIEEIDLIIAGRGGGSIEDLWAFNDKDVALAFFNSKKPIISAVGHEIDNLLSDLTADARAATPTQAVELSVPERVKVLETLDDRKRYLNSVIRNQIEILKKELEKRENSYSIKNFSRELENKNQELVEREERLKRAIQYQLNEIKNSLDRRVHKVITLNPLETLKRGYSVVTKENEVIKSVKNIKIEDEIAIKVTDGIIKGRVKEIN
ncbi:exodeoxyribonuclease VII large subunit [Fusobacterium sp.]|jgi:exodeoxyribonuclease VII large subunit|uniref:exodeoxyribonuclease VII large subunit n=1 Tax=Fusobacterium sp. TaxID=68766 RepID=UPI002618CAEA|nr:exodeoxyribonuclease VII large subunit [Fusobacterium sp.]MDY3058831.1 exodeoxyribonuclease VII large subunit [Fusobacterium sp.]MEE1476576.1 exodeoxyribonuclease VII large subunit [Fusobacterium sp.]